MNRGKRGGQGIASWKKSCFLAARIASDMAEHDRKGQIMRVALTGGATGIGAEVAKMLAEEGHEVTAFDIREPSGVAHWFETDLSDPASIKAATDAASGSFDALINNAGVPPRPGQ